MKACGAVIAGGGVIGASIAYHLAKKGLKDIVVIDKFPKPGMGSTGKATGGFRAQFGSEINIRLSILSYEKLNSFKDETGIDPHFEKYGYLFLAQNDDELSILKQANQLQKSCGLNKAEILSPDEIKKLNPYINHTGIVGGSFCGTDGFIKPLNILMGYIESAKKLGVTFLYETEITELIKKGTRISSAVTSKDYFESEIFINACGAWAGEAARFARAEIPVKPLKRQVCAVYEKDLLPGTMPMTIWIDNSFHFRMRDGRLILLLPAEPENNNPFDTILEDTWLEKVFSIAKERIPVLKNSNIDKGSSWAGLYEMSPDEHVLLGLCQGMDNFYLACGSSGHGVMHSPALGQLLSELIMDKKTSVDISALSPARFNEGKQIKSIEFF
jgi:sarcosine oxidase, subunit beta